MTSDASCLNAGSAAFPAPAPVPGAGEVKIGLDEWEALRLKDYLGMDQQEAAEYMKLAQSTFQRILTSARSKLAAAVVEGKSISIEPGNYWIIGRWFCRSCGNEWEAFLDAERKMRQLCPSCGTEQAGQHRSGHGWGPPPWAGPGRAEGEGEIFAIPNNSADPPLNCIIIYTAYGGAAFL